MGLFWIKPDKFLPLDGNSRDLLATFGIKIDDKKYLLYADYVKVMKQLDEKMKTEDLGYSDYAGFSHAAYLAKAEVRNSIKEKKNNEIHYWMYAPGEQAKYWDQYYDEGIMGIGWSKMGNLKAYTDNKKTRNKLSQLYGNHSSHKQDACMLYNFAFDIKPGDIVFAKKGRGIIVGRGIVTSDYIFDENRTEQPNIRKVNWTDKGNWKTDTLQVTKTLTDITPYLDYVAKLNRLIDGNNPTQHSIAESEQSGYRHYWWLVANPKIWSLNSMKIGEEQDYTLYNEFGHKRKVSQNFLDAKAGDIVIGYESTPTKQIVGLLEVSKANDGNVITFKKKEVLPTPIDYSALKNIPELEEMEYMKNQQGTFFKVSAEEYDIIMELVRGENPLPTNAKKEIYNKKKFLNEVFISFDDYDQLEILLLRKKNLILQGAPGVGKTFAARRLAYAIMGEKDDSRVMQVQFHQNYSYEDFVMGYKPNEDSGFEMKNGIFYRFCKRAAADKDHKYFFIIDEINRGNLSKIFGELLMLIENDYRDKPIQLSYKDEQFSVPNNLYLIGMMNTADRSLAMIDYALRRRFSFFEMKPGFESPQFEDYVKSQTIPHLDKLVKAIIELNKVIESDDSLGSGFCIGHSYLCNLDNSIDLKNIVEYDIIPMLKEYWFDNNHRFNQEAQKLREAVK
ncbi:MAG: EVE domain-containing protein [Bacteroidales bacterium]|nr:EVE domain-containing protein [Bacteroidales bacterium]